MPYMPSLSQLQQTDAFLRRHLGPDQGEQQAMLVALGLASREQLIEQTVPPAIRLQDELNLPPALDEQAALAKLKSPDAWRSMSFAQIRRLARETCAKQDDYLSARQPVLETVFRMLLVSPSGTMLLDDIHEKLTGLWTTSPWPRHIGIDALRRVLDHAGNFGIGEVESK